MNSTRGVIACALVGVILFGPLSEVLAQQPAAVPPAPAAVPPAPAAAPPAPTVAPPPGVVVEMVTPEPPPARGRDIYDVGAGVVTVAKAPFQVALCALGGGFGTALFLLTLGSAYKASTRVIEEGCAQKWIVSGDDLRPRGATGIFPDRTSDAYRNRR
jgi:hypothetical protein